MIKVKGELLQQICEGLIKYEEYKMSSLRVILYCSSGDEHLMPLLAAIDAICLDNYKDWDEVAWTTVTGCVVEPVEK